MPVVVREAFTHDAYTRLTRDFESETALADEARTRIANDLNTATHPNHRKSLEAALAHLDKKISDLS